MLVEIWSDVVCPWCAIGRSRFQRALDAYPHADEVEVRWRSFELDPNRPGEVEGDYVAMLAAKYRTSRDEAQAMVDRMTAAGAEEGVTFRFDLARPGNTFDAHRLLHLAADRGVQDAVKARLLEGYHGEGERVAHHPTLRRLAVEAGLEGDEVDEVLAGDRYADAVRADEAQAHEYGISGVPFFVLDRRIGVSGAQPAEHLLTALHQARQDGDAAARDAEHDDHTHHDCTDGACVV